MIFDVVTLTLKVDLLYKKIDNLTGTMTFESEGLLIVAIYIWLPPASYVVFLTTLVEFWEAFTFSTCSVLKNDILYIGIFSHLEILPKMTFTAVLYFLCRVLFSLFVRILVVTDHFVYFLLSVFLAILSRWWIQWKSPMIQYFIIVNIMESRPFNTFESNEAHMFRMMRY